MQLVADFFRWLADAHGVNVSIFYDKADQSRFRKTDRGHFELTEAGKQAQ